MNYPLVSVIIPTYNHGAFIDEAIRSVLNQTYKNIEIIIIDDGSTDNTKNILGKYHDKITYKFQDNKGPSAARNRGLAETRGEYIAFLDADDVWLPNKLEMQLLLMLRENSNNLGIVGCSAYIIDKEGNIKKTWIAPRNVFREEYFRRLCLRNNLVGGTSSVLIRRRVFDKIGLFKEELLFGEDWDMWLRIIRYYDVAFVKEPLVKLRKHNSVKNYRNIKVIKENSIQIIENNLKDMNVMLRKKVLSFLYIDLARLCMSENKRLESMHYIIKSFLSYPLKVSSEDLKYNMAIRLLIPKIFLKKTIENSR